MATVCVSQAVFAVRLFGSCKSYAISVYLNMAEADDFVFVLDEELSEDDLVAMTVTIPSAMEEFDVDFIRIEETRRASSAGPGRAVRPLRFRRRKG